MCALFTWGRRSNTHISATSVSVGRAVLFIFFIRFSAGVEGNEKHAHTHTMKQVLGNSVGAVTSAPFDQDMSQLNPDTLMLHAKGEFLIRLSGIVSDRSF